MSSRRRPCSASAASRHRTGAGSTPPHPAASRRAPAAPNPRSTAVPPHRQGLPPPAIERPRHPCGIFRARPQGGATGDTARGLGATRGAARGFGASARALKKCTAGGAGRCERVGGLDVDVAGRAQPSAASPLDDDDLLSEILLRLPPQPSSLPRASAVCKSWRLLVSKPRFLRRFRLHHRRSPPLLGFFVEGLSMLSFWSAMEAPNRVPNERLSLPFYPGDCFQPLGCRHGLALIFDQTRQQFLVWEPVTGDLHCLNLPLGFDPETPGLNGAVLRAAAGDIHFQVVIVDTGNDDIQPGQRALSWVYSSETGLWGELISTPIPLQPPDFVRQFHKMCSVSTPSDPTTPSVLVGGSLYWQLPGCSSSILEFDFETQILAVIQVPVDLSRCNSWFTVIRADGGGPGFIFVLGFTAQLWERNANCDDVASWVLGRTIELDKLLSLDSDWYSESREYIITIGFAEENNMLFLFTSSGSLFTVQLQSLQFKKLSGFMITSSYYPFECVYTTGN